MPCQCYVCSLAAPTWRRRHRRFTVRSDSASLSRNQAIVRSFACSDRVFMANNGKKHEGPAAGQSEKPASPITSNPLTQALLFAWGFLRHPNMVGWCLPSSRFLVDEVLKQIDWNKAKVIVEYGPGVGAFTTRLLERMRPDATLIALEINPTYITHLQRTLNDPRLVLLGESATEIEAVLARHGVAGADYIISGIPFKTIPDPVREEIVRKTHAALAPDGQFLVYQFSRAVLPYLERVFGRVSRDFEFFNILQARLFYCARSA